MHIQNAIQYFKQTEVEMQVLSQLNYHGSNLSQIGKEPHHSNIQTKCQVLQHPAVAQFIPITYFAVGKQTPNY